ncbi:uncharacterized protein LOC128219069 [Mya arenaria]|uniref:uncharacterized protein LOC128219069 n=1 Tax=Mya arenaria TaxID=6604 RepID=UPI0022E7FE5A|nr:uncharacterized protein LOC128219069 [Mya arenaria]XP_052782848.1 uncharacterized protein LOC128219069 [Mya arenaria]
MEYNRRVQAILSNIMEDIGVTRLTIAKRRRTWLMKEAIRSVKVSLQIYNAAAETRFKRFYFGSQSEATTTLDMGSDIDMLYCIEGSQVICKMGDWKYGTSNLFVKKDEHTPPQHCNLLLLKLESPEPDRFFSSLDDASDDAICLDEEGNSFLLNIVSSLYLKEICLPDEHLAKHGPSVHWDPNFDFVKAFNCPALPEECKYAFARPRPGHWPSARLLDEAKTVGAFVVPQWYSETPTNPPKHPNRGPCLNDYFQTVNKRALLEWRFSTSNMERLFVFDWNLQQLKAYVLLKIIRKTFLKPVIGDRLSTFHMKTAMMFTIESYPPHIWTDDNILNCVSLCLTTLLRWMKLKYCPHFTIANVNLFTGKIHTHELPRLIELISSLVSTHMQCVFDIEMDYIGERLFSKVAGFRCPCPSWIQANGLVAVSMAAEYTSEYFKCLVEIMHGLEKMDYSEVVLMIRRQTGILKKWCDNGSDLEKEAAGVLQPMWSTASIRVSKCMELKRKIPQKIMEMNTLRDDLGSVPCKLKYASMFYCSGQYSAAAAILSACERKLATAGWQITLIPGRECRFPLGGTHSIFIMRSNIELFHSIIVTSVVFSRHEMHSLPGRLVYEMFRTVTNEDKLDRHPYTDIWMDFAVVDPVPFLYYLQFLTYTEMGDANEKQRALDKLVDQIKFDNGQFETLLNMLGHCLELNGEYVGAWSLYKASLSRFRRNNATVWHMCILVNLLISNCFIAK